MRASWMALAFIAIWPATVSAQMTVGVSHAQSGTKTHFVWTGARKNTNPDRMLNLIVQNSSVGEISQIAGLALVAVHKL